MSNAAIGTFIHYVVLFSAYAVLWFLWLFCLLPGGLGAERDPDSGAPLSPMLGRKALIAGGPQGGQDRRLLAQARGAEGARGPGFQRRQCVNPGVEGPFESRRAPRAIRI